MSPEVNKSGKPLRPSDARLVGSVLRTRSSSGRSFGGRRRASWMSPVRGMVSLPPADSPFLARNFFPISGGVLSMNYAIFLVTNGIGPAAIRQPFKNRPDCDILLCGFASGVLKRGGTEITEFWGRWNSLCDSTFPAPDVDVDEAPNKTGNEGPKHGQNTG